MLPYDSNSHNAYISHKKAASDLKTHHYIPLFLCNGKQPTKFLGLCTFKTRGVSN